VDNKDIFKCARWYDPQARRFISEDPIGLNGGINLYAYVGNNPVNATDPSGLEILVQWHKVLGTNIYHSLITIIPENQEFYKENSDFITDTITKKRYATIGAGPNDLLLRFLKGDINRPNDREPHTGGNLVNFKECNEDDYIAKLLAASRSYSNNLRYAPFPEWAFPGHYNSNSYVNGLIMATGGTVTKPSIAVPGGGIVLSLNGILGHNRKRIG